MTAWPEYQVVGWVNVYKDRSGRLEFIGVYQTLEEANDCATTNRLACIHVAGMEGYLGDEAKERGQEQG